MEINEQEKHMIEHSLGLGWKEVPYRNFYNSNPTDLLDGLVEKGLIQRRKVRGYVGSHMYSVTEKGIDLFLGYGYCEKNRKMLEEKEIIRRKRVANV